MFLVHLKVSSALLLRCWHCGTKAVNADWRQQRLGVQLGTVFGPCRFLLSVSSGTCCICFASVCWPVSLLSSVSVGPLSSTPPRCGPRRPPSHLWGPPVPSHTVSLVLILKEKPDSWVRGGWWTGYSRLHSQHTAAWEATGLDSKAC